MIKVKILENNNKISCISVTGHAGYDDFGKDIVCSAVSTCVITTVNGISLLNENYLSITQDTDKLEINILLEDINCDRLIQNMLNILTDLESQYPKNIKIIKQGGLIDE